MSAKAMKAPVPPPSVEGVEWLVLEPDPDSSGWFVFGLEDLDGMAVFDHWYPSLEEAFRQTE